MFYLTLLPASLPLSVIVVWICNWVLKLIYLKVMIEFVWKNV